MHVVDDESSEITTKVPDLGHVPLREIEKRKETADGARDLTMPALVPVAAFNSADSGR